MLLWEGKSSWRGAVPEAMPDRNIRAILTGYDPQQGLSSNSKTGPMAQLWILVSSVNPYESIDRGGDVLVCGSCERRPGTCKDAGCARCYVRMRAPNQTWQAHKQSSVVSRRDWPSFWLPRLGLRAGAYGDPGCLPRWLVEGLAKTSQGNMTSYTQRWRVRSLDWLKAFSMASCRPEAEVDQALALGRRPFYSRPVGEPLPKGCVQCPAAVEAGKMTTCQRCQWCNGHSGRRAFGVSDEEH